MPASLSCLMAAVPVEWSAPAAERVGDPRVFPAGVPDPRKARGVRHSLVPVLVVAAAAVDGKSPAGTHGRAAHPARVTTLVRGHRDVENRLHRVRDAACDEDRSRVRTSNAPRLPAGTTSIAGRGRCCSSPGPGDRLPARPGCRSPTPITHKAARPTDRPPPRRPRVTDRVDPTPRPGPSSNSLIRMREPRRR
ncbi:hypothetical protein [Saccharothrix syringae]|uniref:Transposase family protein n=1 Tax=Saccharothrix syringae TaxID=103733 RepID=A0A5Q0HC80_SACSY|nr:hypothetical protein [Saccharothrix syringae]QFZ23791.1 hypothetical protein EKG83_45780 [Saccharothrix syringae]